MYPTGPQLWQTDALPRAFSTCAEAWIKVPPRE